MTTGHSQGPLCIKMERLGLESPEGKTDVTDACQTRMEYSGQSSRMRGWPEFTFTDKGAGRHTYMSRYMYR